MLQPGLYESPTGLPQVSGQRRVGAGERQKESMHCRQDHQLTVNSRTE